MSYVDTLVERSKQVATRAGKGQQSLAEALPHVKAVIIGCADMRVEPAIIFGLAPGEAVVLRNIGGRVVPSLLQQLGLLGQIGQAEQKIPGGGGEFHIIVLHHTDCGIKRLAKSPESLAPYFQVSERQLDAKHVTDPHAAVKVDVAALHAVSALPDPWLISGLVYDVTTGKVEVVVPPAPVR